MLYIHVTSVLMVHQQEKQKRLHSSDSQDREKVLFDFVSQAANTMLAQSRGSSANI